MSDYMTEIEVIKNAIESTVTVFVAQDKNEKGIVLTKHSLLLLITTIESQKEEIEKLNLIHSDYRRTALERIAYQEQQIEGYKAITELAVKGLEYYTGTEHAEIVRRYYFGETQFDGLSQRARVVLDQIERLQNAQT